MLQACYRELQHDMNEKSDTATTVSVSVIIPAYNSAHCISDTLESVYEQTCLPKQVIVIDDGSTDATKAVVTAFGSRVTYVYQENAGQGMARNLGLDRATGDYVAFLDADDYWKPRFLETCYSYLEEHPEVDIVSTLLVTRYSDGSEKVQPESLLGSARTMSDLVLEHFFDFWAEHDHIRTGTNLIRMSLIKKAGGQRADLRISQDLEYWGYLGTFGTWAFIPEPLWVGNSRIAAARSGWRAKYRQRRRLCPTVEAWEQRIVTRLNPEDRKGFEIVRGRVAAGYAHNKILGGAPKDALHIVRTYGDSMPCSRLTRLMRWGAKLGFLSWKLACGIIIGREMAKDWRLQIISIKSSK
jgi:glycosyltransferase involved in cell wall biosynthesis